MEEVVIIGGGVAGLSAANALLDSGKNPLLIEAGRFGQPRVCGEFISEEAVGPLEAWGVAPIQKIRAIDLSIAGKEPLAISLPKPCGSAPRVEIERKLLQRARFLGGRFREEAKITKIIPPSSCGPDSSFRLELGIDEHIEAKSIVVAAGRVGALASAPPLLYMGFNAHFSAKEHSDRLSMWSWQGAYLGIGPQLAAKGAGMNCACLTTRENIERFGSVQAYFNAFVSAFPRLQELFGDEAPGLQLVQQEGWQSAALPMFAMKRLPPWPRAYFVGDALATIPPISGGGMAISVTSAIEAAAFLARDDCAGYRSYCVRAYRSRIQWAKIVHSILSHRLCASGAVLLCRMYPQVALSLFRRMRG